MPDFNGLPLSLERVTGWFFSPVAWCMGIPWDEAQTAGELLGIKTYHSANSYLEKLTNLFVRVNFFYKLFAIRVLKQQNL
jgi:nucleoside permease NupC